MDPMTNTFQLMNAVRTNLKAFAGSTTALEIKSVKSFSVGFVFPQTVFPAITVFPLEKKFGARRSDGRQIAMYRFTVDVYSDFHIKAESAKVQSVRLIEDVRNCLRGAIKMVGENGEHNCFGLNIAGEQISESRNVGGRGFRSTGSITVEFMAFHQMNRGRVVHQNQNETDTDSFLSLVTDTVKASAVELGSSIKTWISKIDKPIVSFPAVVILPGNESISGDRTNRVDVVSRPVAFNMVSRGIPKEDVLAQNMALIDALVSTIERCYSIGGYALDGVIDSIQYDYASEEAGFNFVSTAMVTYTCLKKFNRVVNS